MDSRQCPNTWESSAYDGPAYQATEEELVAEEILHQASPNPKSSLSSHFWQQYITSAFPFPFPAEQASYGQEDFLPGTPCVLRPSVHDLMSPHGHGSLFDQDATGLETGFTTYRCPVAADARVVDGLPSWTPTNDPLLADGPATPSSVGSPGLTDGATPATHPISTPTSGFLSEPGSELEDETPILPNGRRAIARNPASTTRYVSLENVRSTVNLLTEL
jgi:hypothetical protein